MVTELPECIPGAKRDCAVPITLDGFFDLDTDEYKQEYKSRKDERYHLAGVTAYNPYSPKSASIEDKKGV